MLRAKPIFNNKLQCIAVLFLLVLFFFWPLKLPRVNLFVSLLPPMWMSKGSLQFPLGTDALGRSILTQLLTGSRVSLLIGFGAVLIGSVMGTLIGVVSGFYGGWFDNLLMRMVELLLIFPSTLLSIALLATFGSGLEKVIFVLAINIFTTFARVIRGLTLDLKSKEFITASRALGSYDFVIIIQHILPNILPSFLALAQLSFAKVMLLEASLSFLGLGAKPSTPTLGTMIADGYAYLFNGWWISFFPGLALLISVFCVFTLGNWLYTHITINNTMEILVR